MIQLPLLLLQVSELTRASIPWLPLFTVSVGISSWLEAVSGGDVLPSLVPAAVLPINLIATAALVPQFGMSGAAAATLTQHLVAVLLLLLLARYAVLDVALYASLAPVLVFVVVMGSMELIL